MKYIFTTLLLVSATLALPTDFSSQESTTAATQQDGIGVVVGLLDDTLGLGRRGDLTSIQSSVKRDNQDAQEATAKDFEGPFGPGLPNGVAF
ncbi:hypothetical protein ASPFODRAFT_42312 [Aspergillus luchuensis CBS 106.47]|uniref:Uncharacterized protein n=1 Tax=Aspergillus luchuensis (strain CBS 106.47) TaxID=1137211 RepID=A0A1M3TRF8_ASPLC|nr:hypothetical protein ASPFODRAFT_42312 [Aspergillus luchuensis CBS 106.47]